jgi:hypothetical protein
MARNSRNVWGYVAPNGLNFSRCITNQNSRISRALRYIQSQNEMGKAVTRKDILRDVFNNDRKGWASYLFTFGVKNKFLNKVRIGKTFVYSAGRRSHLVSI